MTHTPSEINGAMERLRAIADQKIAEGWTLIVEQSDLHTLLAELERGRGSWQEKAAALEAELTTLRAEVERKNAALMEIKKLKNSAHKIASPFPGVRDPGYRRGYIDAAREARDIAAKIASLAPPQEGG